MVTYSHSRLSCFENCPYQYKLKYIDKIKVDIPTTIEAFMGDMVHRSLEHLHHQTMKGNIPSMDALIEFYLRSWEEEYTPDILIAKASQGLTDQTYKLMGLKFLMDYYERKKPFEGHEIVGLETKDSLKLADGNSWHVMIDKLERDGNGTYFVCDYKTNARMKTKEEADTDRQLAMYAAWVKERFPDAKKIILKWDMLACNKEITSVRSDKELQKVQESVVSRISQINNTTNFSQKPSGLCNYCVFKDICPAKNPHTSIRIPTTLSQQKLPHE